MKKLLLSLAAVTVLSCRASAGVPFGFPSLETQRCTNAGGKADTTGGRYHGCSCAAAAMNPFLQDCVEGSTVAAKASLTTVAERPTLAADDDGGPLAPLGVPNVRCSYEGEPAAPTLLQVRYQRESRDGAKRVTQLYCVGVIARCAPIEPRPNGATEQSFADAFSKRRFKKVFAAEADEKGVCPSATSMVVGREGDEATEALVMLHGAPQP